MSRQRVFLTGATGGMGLVGLNELLKDADTRDVVILARPSERNRALLAAYAKRPELIVEWGDLTNYDDVLRCVRGADVVLHVGALVSPEADYQARRAMDVNYGSTMNILTAIGQCGQAETTKLVSIGTVAETGDRMPPLHWGRVGDPIKPSVYDYYAVSKVAAERAVIESGLKRWVSLRQTGILSKKMAEIEDAIMFHNCLDNVLEYVSDRDSGVLLRNACGPLPEEFWNHVYNIGGGAGCRTSTWAMYRELFGSLGITNMENCLDSRWFATRNFHGHFYLDSDRLEDYLHFRHDSLQYFYDVYLASQGDTARLTRVLCRLPFGERVVGRSMKKRFLRSARTEHGTVHFVEDGVEEAIAAYWGSKAAFDAIPRLNDFAHFTDWDTVVRLDHGYDESKPESELTLDDVRGAARFRGGVCLADSMAMGDWRTPLAFRCAFGHQFRASPRLVLEGGHWCDVCERESWNYPARARRDPFFAQVWYPLHPVDEPPHVYPKAVDERGVRFGPSQGAKARA